ncbi:NAD(P)H-binding protein [Nocardia sp. NPDC004582]
MAAIAVIGAAGRTGRVVVDRALARGHRVTAIVRRAGSFTPAPGSTVIVADPTLPGSLAGRFGEQDAVISTLGAAGRGPTTVYSAGTAHRCGYQPFRCGRPDLSRPRIPRSARSRRTGLPTPRRDR